MEDVFFLLARVARRQHALITLDQTRDLGMSRHVVDRLVASGRLVRVAPRVLLVNGTPFTWQGRMLAECLSAGADAVVSHRSAAALYELQGFDPLRIVHLTLPRGRRPDRRHDVRLHRSLDWNLIQWTTRQDVPVTGIARLLLDLYASERNLEVARRGLFSARKKKLVTWGELYKCLDAHARPGRRGISRLRSDLDLYSRIGCPETSFEDRIRGLLVAAGLPEPELQYWVTAGGRRYRIDVAYPGPRVGIEGKSKEHHLTDEAFEADPLRDADLAIDGWVILHVTSAHLRDDPDGVVRRVRRALRKRGVDAA